MARIGLKLREVMKGRPAAEGVRVAGEVLREAIRDKKIAKEDISLREMAQSLIGDGWEGHLRNVATRGAESPMAFRESVDAVDSSGFSSITGQLLVDEIKDKYKLATFVTDQMFRTIKVTNGNLGTHVVPYLTDVVDDPDTVQQGQKYSETSFQGQYITLAAPAKFGRICSVTFEAIYSDLTKQILDSAGSVGRRVGLWVEKKRLRVALGLDNNHVWNGTSYNTYQAATPWINSKTDFTLTDWKSIQTLELMFSKILDPVLNEPIEIEGAQWLTVPSLRYTAKRILNATEVRSGDITTGTGDQLVSANPLDGSYQLLTSKHMRRQALTYGSATWDTEPKADTINLFGDFKKAFYWREVFPMQTVQAPPMNQAEFEQDIVLRVKANVFGVAGVWDPRYVIRAYNASAT
jgi:hypothetical protein